jgi:hypothetical protein
MKSFALGGTGLVDRHIHFPAFAGHLWLVLKALLDVLFGLNNWLNDLAASRSS